MMGIFLSESLLTVSKNIYIYSDGLQIAYAALTICVILGQSCYLTLYNTAVAELLNSSVYADVLEYDRLLVPKELDAARLNPASLTFPELLELFPPESGSVLTCDSGETRSRLAARSAALKIVKQKLRSTLHKMLWKSLRFAILSFYICYLTVMIPDTMGECTKTDAEQEVIKNLVDDLSTVLPADRDYARRLHA